MDKVHLHVQGDVLIAVLDSCKQVNHYSQVLSITSVLLILFGADFYLKILASLGLLLGLLQGYFNWRVALDKKLLPILFSKGSEVFDQALALVFPAKAKQLGQRDLNSRLNGIKLLLYKQIFSFIAQLLVSLSALGLFIQASHV